MGLKEIKIRITAIKKTASITKAMQNIALSKVKKATDQFEEAQRFSEELNETMSILAHHTENNRFIEMHPSHQMLYVLVTSDRGLAGGYHSQLFKAFLNEINTMSKEQILLLPIGKKASQFAKSHHFQTITHDVLLNRDDISLLSYDQLGEMLMDSFLQGHFQKIVLVYSHYESMVSQVVSFKQLLPLSYTEKNSYDGHIFDELPEVVLEDAVKLYLQSTLYEVVSDAKLSEHASRMVAMKNATDNANQIVGKLTLQYHRARQQAITSELIDVINGSNV
jgi:F-type H+-transporting ATPase subunit gamma